MEGAAQAWARFDDDHNELVRLMDALLDAVTRSDEESVQELLLRLLDTSTNHFSSEQELMRALGFPAYEEHAAEHDWFLDHLAQLLDSHAQGRNRLTLERARALRPWLAEHTQTRDRALADYVLVG